MDEIRISAISFSFESPAMWKTCSLRIMKNAMVKISERPQYSQMNLVPCMALIAQLSLIFTEVADHISAVITIYHIVAGHADVT